MTENRRADHSLLDGEPGLFPRGWRELCPGGALADGDSRGAITSLAEEGLFPVPHTHPDPRSKAADGPPQENNKQQSVVFNVQEASQEKGETV